MKKGEIEKEEDNVVKIFSFDDKYMKELGQVIKTFKSKKMFELLDKKDMHAKEIGKILDNMLNVDTNDNPRLPNLHHHLNKMVEIGLLTSTVRDKNGHKLQYYRSTAKVILIVPEKYYEKAKKSKTLRNSFKAVFKFTVIGIAGLISWELLPRIPEFTKDTFTPQNTTNLILADPNYTIIPFVVIIAGLVTERISTFFLNRK